MSVDDSTRREAWWRHLAGVRWFGGKGSAGAISALEALPWYTAEGVVPRVRSEIATIDYADGRREFYHLLAAYYPAGQAPVAAVASDDAFDIVDATTDAAALRAFMVALASHPGTSWTREFSEPAPQVGVFAGEQSNTTLTVGPDALLKLFRRIEPGPNLDAEVLSALSARGASVPPVWGRLTGPWPQGSTTDLGLAMGRIPRASDGWELACAACAQDHDFTDEARALGEALRRVHADLREAFGTQFARGADLAATMRARLDAAVQDAPALAPHARALGHRFDSLAGRELEVQRVHGDFHLGQTLHNDDGWTLLDFEGEPAKTAAERRAFDSLWRDVAGMIRSFDYARSAHDDPSGAQASAWSKACMDAFLDGYLAPGESPDPALEAYITDKAAYEVVYETRNRPTWVAIPLRAIEELASSAFASPDERA